jgi:lipopolysaccharide biosynthesis glycosyltransferase
MIIACVTDHQYADMAGVLLHSIEANGQVPDARVVVFGHDLPEADKERLRGCVEHLTLEVRDIPAAIGDRIKELPSNQLFPAASSVRLLLGDLLPDDSGRVLYLDSDTLVNGSLRPLFTMQMRGRIAAAVQDPAHPDMQRLMNRRIGRAEDAVYVNSGVLLIELGRWRHERVGERCLDWMAAHPEAALPDQDALNVILGGEFALLDRRWNLFTEVPGCISAERYSAATVVHFSGYAKPTFAECTHPLAGEFIRLRLRTPWKDVPILTRRPHSGLLGLPARLRSRKTLDQPRSLTRAEYRALLARAEPPQSALQKPRADIDGESQNGGVEQEGQDRMGKDDPAQA